MSCVKDINALVIDILILIFVLLVSAPVAGGEGWESVAAPVVAPVESVAASGWE